MLGCLQVFFLYSVFGKLVYFLFGDAPLVVDWKDYGKLIPRPSAFAILEAISDWDDEEGINLEGYSQTVEGMTMKLVTIVSFGMFNHSHVSLRPLTATYKEVS